jgi:UDP-N-acetylmuramate dehydrogenase
MKIINSQSLKDLNTFGLEVTADRFLSVQSKAEAAAYFRKKQPSEKVLILGGGSNLLFRNNFEGLVLKNDIKGIKLLKENEEHVWLEVGAGENWHEFVLYCIENAWAGVENLSLIPGNVGASPMQNIGAYGVEVKSVIESVETISREDGHVKTFLNKDCEFDYRSSIFKTKLRDKYLISSVTFKLNKQPSFNVSYGAIKAQLEASGIKESELSLKAVSNAVIEIRRSKLPDPSKIGNSGSFFKNPIVEDALYQELKSAYPNIPAYPQEGGKTKLAAAWLIEKAGWKGYKEGNYGVHAKQALVLVNYGGASGEELFQLSSKIVKSVEKQFGVTLEREVNIIN